MKMLDMNVTRYNPPKSILDIKYNISSLFSYFTIWILLLDILYLNYKISQTSSAGVLFHCWSARSQSARFVSARC